MRKPINDDLQSGSESGAEADLFIAVTEAGRQAHEAQLSSRHHHSPPPHFLAILLSTLILTIGGVAILSGATPHMPSNTFYSANSHDAIEPAPAKSSPLTRPQLAALEHETFIAPSASPPAQLSEENPKQPDRTYINTASVIDLHDTKPRVKAQSPDAHSVDLQVRAPRLKPTRLAALGTPGFTTLQTHPLNLHRLEDVQGIDVWNSPPLGIIPISFGESPEAPHHDLTPTLPSSTKSSGKVSLHRDVTLQLRRGETLASLLTRANVREKDRTKMISALSNHLNLRDLKAGATFLLTFRPKPIALKPFSEIGPQDQTEEMLISLTYPLDRMRELRVTRSSQNTFLGRISTKPTTTQLRLIQGKIDDSLYQSMRRAGAPDNIVDSLANIFAFQIDFQRDIFRGDEFEAIFEVTYDDQGEIIQGGKLYFGRMTWRGGRHERAYYAYEKPDTSKTNPSYFDANGKSAKRLLMKTPIDGARLSSRFGPRKHPILGYRKTHKGVDFAARRGTPIKATGDGVIERANRYGSYGNYIRIRHNGGYKTAYAHLKGFRKGIRKGKRVQQGDIIGYVGTTGRSTGPHLHYEVHHKGRAVNPQTLKIANGITLKAKSLEAFQTRRAMIDRLRTPINTLMADASHHGSVPTDGASSTSTGSR